MSIVYSHATVIPTEMSVQNGHNGIFSQPYSVEIVSLYTFQNRKEIRFE